MFKSIQRTLEQRGASLRQQEEAATRVQRCTTEFIRERYPGAVFSVTYQKPQRRVLVSVKGKALAGELLLQSIDLRAHLRENRVDVDRVIIQ